MAYSPQEMLDISMELAREHYIDLAYHNWNGHVRSMLDFVLAEMPILSSLGVPIEKDIVQDAIVWHDADYHCSHTDAGFTTKEGLSAALASQTLSSIGRPDDYVEHVYDCIISTTMGAARTSNEATLVVAADMHNVMGPSTDFFVNTLRIAREQFELGKVLPADAAEFCFNSAKFIKTHLKEPFVYTLLDGSTIKRNEFAQGALANVRALGEIGIEFLRSLPGADVLIPESWLPKN